MFRHTHNGPRRGSPGAAFTLVEIVVALTIVAVIAAVAIPTLKGLGREERARAPMAALVRLVQEVRKRAKAENRPYQIVFERGGIHALADGFPTSKREEFLKALDEARTPPPGQVIHRAEVRVTEVDSPAPKWPTPLGLSAPPPAETTPPPPAEEIGTISRSSEATPPPWEPPWSVSLLLPEAGECEVLFWGDAEWDRLEGEDIRRWVFQPSGVANHARVLLRTDEVEIESFFDALTGEVTRERLAFVSHSQP